MFETILKKNDGKENAFDKWKENEMASRDKREIADEEKKERKGHKKVPERERESNKK